MRYQNVTKLNEISTDVEILTLRNNQIESLKGIHSSLPFLKSLTIDCDKLESLKFLPKTLPNLKRLEIKSESLKSLRYLPPDILKLEHLKIKCESLKSLDYLPSELPKLDHLEIHSWFLKSLENLPKQLPNLKKLIIIGTRIRSFNFIPCELNQLEHLEIVDNYIGSLVKLPRKLPSLTNLIIEEPSLRSFEKIPKNLSKLETLEISCHRIQDLYSLSMNLSNIKTLYIGKKFYPKYRESDKPLQRNQAWTYHIKKFPNLPHLKALNISRISFENLNGLAQKMLNLVNFCFTDCKISNFIGFPEIIREKSKISIERCEIDSFEGFITDFSKQIQFKITDSKIFSFEGLPELDSDLDLTIYESVIYNFEGLSRKNLQKVLLTLYIAVHVGGRNFFQLSSKGFQLLGDCIDYDTHILMAPPEYYATEDKWYNLSMDESITKEDFAEIMDEILEIENVKDFENYLIVSEKVDLLYDYYKRNKFELAYQYRDDPRSLSEDEIERLLTECDHEVLKILENSVPSNDPILLKMIEKFSIRTKKGFKII